MCVAKRMCTHARARPHVRTHARRRSTIEHSLARRASSLFGPSRVLCIVHDLPRRLRSPPLKAFLIIRLFHAFNAHSALDMCIHAVAQCDRIACLSDSIFRSALQLQWVTACRLNTMLLSVATHAYRLLRQQSMHTPMALSPYRRGTCLRRGRATLFPILWTHTASLRTSAKASRSIGFTSVVAALPRTTYGDTLKTSSKGGLRL